ncbi:MAG: hypothetical protein MJ060_04685 [Clostridia bacterium]|nr:hypothetical protein [Clostridia bacterium]
MGVLAIIYCFWEKNIKEELRLAPFILGGAAIFEILGRPDFLTWLTNL